MGKTNSKNWSYGNIEKLIKSGKIMSHSVETSFHNDKIGQTVRESFCCKRRGRSNGVLNAW
jgi:hypothetical protein